MQPYAAWSVTVSPRRDSHAADRRITAQGQTSTIDARWKLASYDLGRIHGGIADLREELERAGMVAMAVREQYCVDFTHATYIGPQAGLRSIAQIQKQPRVA